jgi:hypothetical protein
LRRSNWAHRRPATGQTIQAMIFELQVVQQDDDNLFADIFRLANLGKTFGRRYRFPKGEQDDSLAARIELRKWTNCEELAQGTHF